MKTVNQIIIGIVFIFLFGNCNKDSASAVANNTGTGGSTARFTINGNYLYVVDHISLKAFEITDPQHPVYKSKTDVGINIESIFPYADKLFIGSSFSMYIYSLADPARPSKIAKADYNIRMSCEPVIAKDSVAYATLNSTGPCGGSQSALVVYNIKNIANPVLETTITLTAPWGLGMKDNALYVCEGAGGLHVYNITNRFYPQFVQNVTGHTFYDVIPYGNILIAQIQGGFALYDIGTNPLQPVYVSKILQ